MYKKTVWPMNYSMPSYVTLCRFLDGTIHPYDACIKKADGEWDADNFELIGEGTIWMVDGVSYGDQDTIFYFYRKINHGN